jgi:uncharacterized membrane-anchored protein YitT (DUF2179 family)
MKRKPEAYFLMVILVFSLVIVIRSLTYPSTEAKLLPMTIGGIVFVLTAIVLTRELLAKEKPKKQREEWEGEELELSQYKTIGIWVAAFAIAIYLVGFLIAIPAFIISYLKLNRSGWLKSSIMAVVMIAFIYGVFELLLKVELYRGLLFHW